MAGWSEKMTVTTTWPWKSKNVSTTEEGYTYSHKSVHADVLGTDLGQSLAGTNQESTVYAEGTAGGARECDSQQ